MLVTAPKKGRPFTPRTPEWTAQVLDAYARGQSIIRIAAEFGTSEKTISRTLRSNNVTIRPR